MRALLCRRPHELTLVERPKPEVAPRSALIRLRRVGVCGTDLHIFTGNQPYLRLSARDGARILAAWSRRPADGRPSQPATAST